MSESPPALFSGRSMETVRDDVFEALSFTHSLSETARALESLLKSLKKRADRESTMLEKRLNAAVKKKSRSTGGVSAPVPLSAELCEFLEKPNGYQAARTEVTRQVNAYIKHHGLQVPQNMSYFAPDEKLTQLLGTSKQLSFFSLQGHMNRHFSKKGHVCSQEAGAL